MTSRLFLVGPLDKWEDVLISALSQTRYAVLPDTEDPTRISDMRYSAPPSLAPLTDRSLSMSKSASCRLSA